MSPRVLSAVLKNITLISQLFDLLSYAKFAVIRRLRFTEVAAVNGLVLADNKTKASSTARCGLAGEGSHTFSHACP
jgi:hypothetical protein